MTSSCTYTFYCPHCGKETESGRGWQAYAIVAFRRGLRPRTYELCEDCTQKLCDFLEGKE